MSTFGLMGWRQLALELVKYTETDGTKKPVLKAYWDYAQWSVGYGSYAGSKNKAITPPDNNITAKRAEDLLLRDLNSHAKNYVIPFTKGYKMHEIAALVSMAYNYPALATRIIGMKNKGATNAEIKAKMLEYVNAGGQRLNGLVKRRNQEYKAFIGEQFYL